MEGGGGRGGGGVRCGRLGAVRRVCAWARFVVFFFFSHRSEEISDEWGDSQKERRVLRTFSAPPLDRLSRATLSFVASSAGVRLCFLNITKDMVAIELVRAIEKKKNFPFSLSMRGKGEKS